MELKITPIIHGSLMFEYSGKVIHVDPVRFLNQGLFTLTIKGIWIRRFLPDALKARGLR
jgi:hypothetical protein